MESKAGALSRRVLVEVHERGRREGHRQGRAQGRREALLGAIGSTCEAFGIALDTPTRARLSTLRAEELESTLRRLLAERRPP